MLAIPDAIGSFILRGQANLLTERAPNMMLALRDKQMLAIFALLVLSLIVLALMVMSIAHINVWQALNIKPDAFVPWF